VRGNFLVGREVIVDKNRLNISSSDYSHLVSKLKLIEPRYAPTGTGSRAMFDFANLIQFGIFNFLKSSNVSRNSLTNIFEIVNRSISNKDLKDIENPFTLSWHPWSYRDLKPDPLKSKMAYIHICAYPCETIYSFRILKIDKEKTPIFTAEYQQVDSGSLQKLKPNTPYKEKDFDFVGEAPVHTTINLNSINRYIRDLVSDLIE